MTSPVGFSLCGWVLSLRNFVHNLRSTLAVFVEPKSVNGSDAEPTRTPMAGVDTFPTLDACGLCEDGQTTLLRVPNEELARLRLQPFQKFFRQRPFVWIGCGCSVSIGSRIVSPTNARLTFEPKFEVGG